MKITQISGGAGRGEPGSFRALLQAELARRCARNSRYSLRAFAAELRMDHSTLSQLLRERRPMTERTIRLVGARLKRSPESIETFVVRERQADPGASASSAQIRQLTGDAASVMSDAIHRTILELVRLKEFKPDSRWIARAIGASVDEVNVALTRLLRLGLLEMAGEGAWRDCTGDASATLDGIAVAAIRQLIRRTERLRSAAIKHVAPDLRDHSSCTFAIDTRNLPAVVEMIRGFRRRLAAFLGPGGSPDDVYRLEISLFPATRLKQGPKRRTHGKSRRSVSNRVEKP